jgi:hypothetical protein
MTEAIAARHPDREGHNFSVVVVTRHNDALAG